MKATEFLLSLQKIKIEYLAQIKGLGPNLIQNFEEFINSERFIHLYQTFEKQEDSNNYLDIATSKVNFDNISNSQFLGQKICITGSFALGRNEIKEKLESLGVKVVNSVSTKTNYLLAGQNSGSKLDEANKLGIKIITSLEDIF
jgi:DNA ligase (NAD+)